MSTVFNFIPEKSSTIGENILKAFGEMIKMIIYPAIDLKDNQCVRLSQGDFNKVKVYCDNPLEMAMKFEAEGATYLHLVDLDGAKSEEIVNRQSIENIVRNIGIPVQVGGGIRSEKRVKELLDIGVDRVILGTVAVENQSLLRDLILKYGDKIIVSIDAIYGMVALRGWEVLSEVNSLDLCKQLEDLGVKTIVYTDISKDGMLVGPNFEAYKMLNENTSLNVIASGGVSSIDDIKELSTMNTYGAIVGKALYESKILLKEAFQCLQEE